MNSSKINVKINFRQILDAVKQLSPADKLKLNDLIWEDDYIIPQKHQNLILDRVNEAKKNPGIMLDWDEASKTLIS